MAFGKKKEIYLDNASTTKVDEAVMKAMLPYFTKEYGNASSQHFKGVEAKRALENSRKIIAKSINANTDEIIFTSGGTESNNFILKSLFFDNYPKKDHIIVTKIEHDCILRTCKWLETKGAKVTYLDVDSEGFVNPKDLENSITEKTFLVSIIHGNNEIGTVQDLKKLGEICRKKNVPLHTDACQSFTKVPIGVKKMNLDFVTLNAHKIHGPKGVGAVYVNKNIKISPFFHGGGQERKLRSGTENIAGIVGFAKSVEIVSSKDVKKMYELREKLIEGILKIPDTSLNGPQGEKRLCNNVNIAFKNVEGESIGSYLETKGICTSTGSACMSNSTEPSHVLRAIGLNSNDVTSSVRFSLSKYTTKEEIELVLKELPNIVDKLRKMRF